MWLNKRRWKKKQIHAINAKVFNCLFLVYFYLFWISGPKPLNLVDILLLVFPLIDELRGRASEIWRSRVLQRLVVGEFISYYKSHTMNWILIRNGPVEWIFNNWFAFMYVMILCFWQNFLVVAHFLCRNAETVTYFWQNWNIPVHKWCLR